MRTIPAKTGNGTPIFRVVLLYRIHLKNNIMQNDTQHHYIFSILTIVILFSASLLKDVLLSVIQMNVVAPSFILGSMSY